MCVRYFNQELFLGNYSRSTPMSSIHRKHEGCKSGKVNQSIPLDGTHGKSESPNPNKNDSIEEDISEDIRQLKSENNDEKFNLPNKVKGTELHKKQKIPIFQELLNEYESEISIATDGTHGRSETKTAPNLKENGDVEESNSEDIHLPKSKSYDHGKIAEDDLVIQSPTKIPKFRPRKKDFNADDDLVIQISPITISKLGPRKTGFKFKLNGMIIFTIISTTEQREAIPDSSVHINWIFKTDDAEIKPIIQFQNQTGSFKVTQIDSGKYVWLLARTGDQTKISLIVNDLTDTDYGLYRCLLNNQTEEYRDIKISLTDFTWMSTPRKPVSSTLREDVELSWDYNTTKTINKIVLSRKHQITNHTIEIGIWTIEKGFKQNRVDVSTELVLRKLPINNGSGGERISLELQQTVDDDFDKTYYCHVFYDDQISYRQGVELVAERSTCKGGGIQNDNNNSTFTWVYRYRYPIAATLISRIDSAGKEDDVGFWYQNKFESCQLFKDRVVFNITEQADGRREITLVLINTTASDYNATYICEVIPADGQLCQCRLELVDVRDLNHENNTSITGVAKPRDKILSSTNSTPIIVVAVIIPLLVVTVILATIFVVRKRCNRQKAPTPPECNEKEPCNNNSDSGICSMKEMFSLIDYE